MQQLQNAIGRPTGQTFDNSVHAQPSDAVPTNTSIIPPTPTATPVAPPPQATLTPEQRKLLDQDKDYQRDLAQATAATNAAEKAAAKTANLQAEIAVASDPRKKEKLEAQLSKSKAAEAQEAKRADAAKAKAEERKGRVLRGAPILKD